MSRARGVRLFVSIGMLADVLRRTSIESRSGVLLMLAYVIELPTALIVGD